jgi:hypothetical protein
MVRVFQGLFAAMLLAACSTPRTQVMLVVDTDIRPPRGLDSFTVAITGPDGETRTSTATLGADQPGLPRTLALVHEQGPLGPFTVRVAGNTGPSERVARTARFTFQPERTLMLRIDLLASCIGVSCAAEQTCAADGCRAVDVAAAELTEWTGTPPALDPDASTPADAGRDAGLDASTDAGTDAGADAGVDAGTDAGADAGADAGTDAGADAGTDAGADAGTDAGVDAGVDMGFDAGLDASFDMGFDAGFDAGPPDLGVDLCAPMSEICNGLDDDCNGMIDDGVDTSSDVMNCGGCGRPCNFQNSAGGICNGGRCMLTGPCNPGFGNCNGLNRDGCEVNLNTDARNCGGCGDRCSGGRVCCASMCATSCP